MAAAVCEPVAMTETMLWVAFGGGLFCGILLTAAVWLARGK
jgi:hypothetical protein